MSQQIPSNTKLDKVMSLDQFNQVVEAILAGKYSWACVLILRFAGYNPLHYIPYRTYIRLVKDHYQNEHSSSAKADEQKKSSARYKCISKVEDLNYLEEVEKQHKEIQGGVIAQWLNIETQEFGLLKW